MGGARRCGRGGWGALTTAALLLVVTAAPSLGRAQTGGVGAALELLGMPADLAAELAASSTADPAGDTFRYAAEGSRPATLDLPHADILEHGAARVGWSDPPQLVCGGEVDGAVVVCNSGTAQLDGGVVLYWARFAGPVPAAPAFVGNLAFPTLTPGGTPWEANPAFAWDTFQGADRWLQLVAQPDERWAVLSQRWNGSEVQTTGTDLFAVFAGDTVVAGVPLAELGLPPLTDAQAAPALTLTASGVVAQAPAGIGYGVAIHLHDGTFGRDPSDASVVDSAPDTDGPTRRGPDDLATPISDDVSVPAADAPEPEPEPEATEPEDAGTRPPATDPAPTDGTSTDTGGGFPWVPVILVILLIVGGGLLWARRRPASTPCTCTLSVTVEGPAKLRVCCMELEATLLPVRYQASDEESSDPEGGKRRSDPSRRHLDLDVKGEADWHFTDQVLVATPSVSCSGGGSIDPDAITYDWSLAMADDALTITVTARAAVSCPGAGEHPHVEATATHRIALEQDRCRITVLLEQNTWGEKLYNHADVMIECGEYREIFGWFPRSDGTEVFTGSKAYVNRWPGARANVDKQYGLTSIENQIGGADLKAYRGATKTKAWVIEPDRCIVCVNLRRQWMETFRKVGGSDDAATDSKLEYSLLGQNCVYMVWRSLIDSEAIPKPTLPEWATRPTIGGDLENIMDGLAGKTGAGGTFHASEVLQ